MGIRMNVKWFMALLVGAVMFSCSNDVLMEAPEVLKEEAASVATLIAGYSEVSRLAYEEQGDAIKITWADGDALVANATPGNESNAFTFNLTGGVGTTNGVFTCSNGNPQNLGSNGWTIYYPGSTIQCEQDWFNFSYLGQKQKGNNNLAHLKNYHSMRLVLDGMVAFQDTYINFSGDGVDQSMCVKFNLSGFQSPVTPTKLELMYINDKGAYENCFHTYNFLTSWWGGATPNAEAKSRMTLELEEISSAANMTAYMMMSNYPIQVKQGGKFRVYLTTTGKKYYCDVAINKDVTLEGGKLHSITCNKWTEASTIDGFDNPQTGVVVIQEATKGSKGADIIIMGDGYDKTQFAADGDYQKAMEAAYYDFFGVEPYTSLKDYFNVYYINAVSEEKHDADATTLSNGAIQGNAKTVFGTQFTANSTTISGNNDMVLEYAKQAIRAKGGKNGTAVTDEVEVNKRVNMALMMVMVNVRAHAGTCWSVTTSASDYGSAWSVAYTALGKTDDGRKWTTVHEAGGHGFGKLADEYEQYTFTAFDVYSWVEHDKSLEKSHSWGYDRNVNEYWCPNSERIKGVSITWRGYNSSSWPLTTIGNVYWSELLNDSYAYKKTLEVNGKAEGLGVYEGAYTYDNFYCRPTGNSVMRDQFNDNGQFFNAISRWAIWYRVMKLTGADYSDFKSSLNDFIKFDNELTIIKNQAVSRGVMAPQDYKPLPPPVMIKGEWINGSLVTE